MNRKEYKCVFFDLDHTLWDYETNSAEALSELYEQYKLDKLGSVAFDSFYQHFVIINTRIWDQYDRGEIHRDVIRNDRFNQVFLHSGIDNYELSLKFSADYINESPKKGNLVPHAREVLDYLKEKYPLYIITNGFEEIQGTKLASSGIAGYFDAVITSARAGHKKPSREIFDFALNENGYYSHESIMIGDNLLTDIAGARNASIDQVFYNPKEIDHQEQVSYEIRSLKELTSFL
jgi:YjjG family noncanonical pyrimidine nucleotidase